MNTKPYRERTYIRRGFHGRFTNGFGRFGPYRKLDDPRRPIGDYVLSAFIGLLVIWGVVLTVVIRQMRYP